MAHTRERDVQVLDKKQGRILEALYVIALDAILQQATDREQLTPGRQLPRGAVFRE